MDYQQISAAEARYSEDRTKDIASEYRFQMPGLSSVFEVFRGMKYSLSRDELELICLGIIEGDHKIDPVATGWISGQDYEYLIESLWSVGFLKAYAVGASRRSEGVEVPT